MADVRHRGDHRHSGTRVRDSDRVDACTLLDAAHAEGELTESEHTERTVAAMRAVTFGDLDALVGDLQIPRNLANVPLVRTDRRIPSRRWQLAAATVAAAALLGALGGCVARVAEPNPPLPDPTTGPGLASFLTAYRERFGDAMVDEVSLYPGYVLVDRPGGEPGRGEDIRYDSDGFDVETTSRGRDVASFDLGALDIDRVAGLIAGAPRTVRIPDGAITHILVRREIASADAEPVLTVHVSDGGRSGFVDLALSGEPIAVHPPTAN
ncbi:DUF1707 domain-containing protein [Nocardia sp. NPDC050406]|uniref:DUF1707 domain-containing protein n=1 Tax=Nocardia sp. NPDC050406 TaxID=3364318 RepID=UPI00378FEA4A